MVLVILGCFQACAGAVALLNDEFFVVGAKWTFAFYSQQFLPALQRSTGRAPTSVFHASAYDATNLLFGALRRAATRVPDGSLVVDRAGLRAAMLDVEGYPGLSGSLTCDPGGDCSQISRIAIYKAPAWPSAEGSQAVPVYSSARSLAEVKLGE